MSTARKAPAKKRAGPAAKKRASRNEAALLEDKQAIKPFFLVEPYGPGAGFDLCLADSDSPVEVFEAAGHTGSGYAWDSVARIALAKLGLSETIRFDSEAGTFVALAETREPLLALGRALAALLHDEPALAKVIQSVPEDDWDD